MLPRRLPDAVFWTSLENAPRTALSGLLQRRRGVKSGLPDLMFISPPKVIFIEVKARDGRASRAQKRTRDELCARGCEWWLCRSAKAALTALHRSGVELRSWRPVPLRPWEGPFDGTERRPPQHPEVRARQREANRRWRERKRARKAAVQAVERDDGAGALAASETAPA